MKSEHLHRQKIDTDYIASVIRSELQSSISEIKENSSLTIENLTKSMENALENMSKRKMIASPEYSNDLQVSTGNIYIYEVSYKNQLNSIHFITGKEDVKIMFISLSTENIDLAKEKAILEVDQGAIILDVVFDHPEEDPTRVDIMYSFRPLGSMNYFACNITVAV
jgi:hypothetical protein